MKEEEQELETEKASPPVEEAETAASTGESAEVCQNETLRFQDFFDISDGNGPDSSAPVPCSTCGQSFLTNGLLDMHWQKVHEAKALLHCVDCKTDFRRKMALIAHYRTAPAHRLPGFGGERLIGCDICDAFNVVSGFKDNIDLVRHTKAVHGQDVIVNSLTQTKFICPFPTCVGEFAYRKGMIEHVQILHCDHLIAFLLGVTGEDKDRLMGGMHYKCNFCSKVYRVSLSLKQHLSARHGDHKGLNSPLRSPTKKPVTNFFRKSLPAGVEGVEGGLAKKLPESTPRTRPVRTTASLKRSRASPTPTSSPPAKKSRKDSEKKKYANDAEGDSPTSGIVICTICKKTFSRSSVLNVHSQMVHGQAVTSPMASPSKSESGDSGHKDTRSNGANKSAETAKTKIASPTKTASPVKPAKDLEAIFNSEAFKSKAEDPDKAAKEFYGEENLLKTDDLEEDCLVEGCSRRFLTYFSMMRHVAFHHNPVLTAKLLKLA